MKRNVKRKRVRMLAVILSLSLLMQYGMMFEPFVTDRVGVSASVTARAVDGVQEGKDSSQNPSSENTNFVPNTSTADNKNATGNGEQKIQVENIEKLELDTEKVTTSFIRNEVFSTENLVVKAVNKDKTVQILTPSDYRVSCDTEDINTITQKIGYKNIKISVGEDSKTVSNTYEIKVIPPTITNFAQYSAGVSEEKDASGNVIKKNYTVSLNWDEVEGVTGYQIIAYDENTKKWEKYIKGGPTNNYIPNNNCKISNLTPGTDYEYRVRSFVKTSDGKVVYSRMTSSIKVYTKPDKVNNLIYNENTVDSITVGWNAVTGADGYEVYYKKSGDSAYTKLGNTKECSYEATNLTAGKTYYFKVRAYNNTDDYCGQYSDTLTTSTLPGATKVKLKAGAKRLRITWSKVSGATGYNVYVKKSEDTDFQLVKTLASGTYTYIKTGLLNNKVYNVEVRAYRVVNGVSYLAPSSNSISGKPYKVSATSTKAKYYKNKKQFKKSKAYTNLKWFGKNVNYEKSFVMPGTTVANVNGFACYRMCPQAITFAGSYLLMSAYDFGGEENSVIYVMSKSTKKLLTTIVLPDKVHVGGIAYDGKNVWVCHGQRVASIKFSAIKAAAKAKKAYKTVSYTSLVPVKSKASYMTYYKGRLWVGACNESGKQPLYSYSISDKSGVPGLKVQNKIMVPDRVQGIAFLNDGSMVLSRSNLYVSSMRYYLCQLDYYKPKWSGKKITSLGKVKASHEMPTMNEGIAVNGSYLYVMYESTIFPTATVPMDRICAFKVSAVKKK